MNAVDKIQLDLLLAELSHARAAARDRQADEAIRRTLGGRPDALYFLVRRVFQLESALCSARARIGGRPSDGALLESSRDEADPEGRRGVNPWWRRPVAATEGMAVLLRSAEYLFDERAWPAPNGPFIPDA